MKLGKLTAVAFAGALMMMTGCADKSESAKPGMVDLENMPAWVTNPTVENGIGVVGIAKHSQHGMRVMLPKAEMDGRTKLAAEIQTVVSRLSKDTLRQANINELDDYEEQFTEATVNLVKKIPLSGAQRVAMYQDKNTGDLYVHMVLAKREVGSFLADNAASMREQMEQAKMTRQRIDDGMKVMDDMIEELNTATAE